MDTIDEVGKYGNEKVYFVKTKEYNAHYVYSLNFKGNRNGYYHYDLILILSAEPFENPTLKIIFHNIDDFKLGKLIPACSVVLSVKNISLYQLENIKYSVIEDEENLFELKCEDISYEVL